MSPKLLTPVPSIHTQAASRCCRLLPSSLSVLPTAQQHLGAAAYCPAASRCCLLPSSISVLPPTTQQPLGAAYYPAASRCCRLLPSSLSVLPTTQQHLGAAAYCPAASRCCLLIAYPHAAAHPQHQHPIHMPGAAYPTASQCCLPHSIPVLPTTKQHLGAADYQAASRCCHLPPSSTPVLPTNNLPSCPQHLSTASHEPHSISVLHAYS